jgi:hypothetical protein
MKFSNLVPTRGSNWSRFFWGSLQIEDAFPMTEERIRESELRLEDHRANPASSISWAEAKKRLGLV